jgi:RNA polymerase sigma-54 factor
VLTPQLQQAIRLLQLSNQELIGTLQSEVAENPFLDLAETAMRPIDRASAERASGEWASGERALAERAPPTAASSEPQLPPGKAGSTGDATGDWEQPRAPLALDQQLHSRRHDQGGDDQRSLEGRFSEAPSLREELRRQLGMLGGPAAVRALATTLTDWIDDDGYLRDSDEEVARRMGASIERVTAARALLQRCEPIGVGARDLAECLGLQLAERDRLDPAMRRLLDNLPLLAKADWPALLRLCGVDREDLEEMVAELKALDPRPGHLYPSEQITAILPDIVVFRTGPDHWRIELNGEALPRLVVDGDYFAELGKSRLELRQKEFVQERYQNATWLAKALDQRSRTILKVGRAIFARQRAFLAEGPKSLRPLVLRDIATATGLHESTVSRATNQKYAATPHGTFPLKYFFSTAIASKDGGADHSAEVIRQQIKLMIQKEDPQAVLSDDQIVSRLGDAGIVIARRTVAKYREALGIASSMQRRRSKAMAR